MDELHYPVWGVSELTSYIKNLLENDPELRNIWVRGEISNFKHHNSGHMYFTLKDEKSRILAVMFQGYNRFLRFVPRDGMKVLVRGEVSVYERDGQYQLYVKEMQPDGLGSLFLAFQQLKDKLAAEGLFSAAYKKKLPRFPSRIALITSPTGAAIRDMITTLRRRYPCAEVLVIPVLVQGEAAPRSIVEGLSLANRFGDLDLIILGRGGGSIEELWAFNDEAVARAIFRSEIPVISAVGHETDFTIADFVADVRAATPTAAAELAVPDWRELRAAVDGLKHRLRQACFRLLVQKRLQLNGVRKAAVFRRPLDRIEQWRQYLDRLNESLGRFVKQMPAHKRTALQHLNKRLLNTGIPRRIAEGKARIRLGEKRMQQAFHRRLEREKLRLGYLMQHLEALSPLSVLRRGYALAFDDEGRIVKSVRQLSPGKALTVQFQDGSAETSIWGIREEESLWKGIRKS